MKGQDPATSFRCSLSATLPDFPVTVREDIVRWNQKYAAGDHYVEPQGEAELVANRQYLDGRGCALELACGKGANALYLASIGYRVVAIDGALEGLKICDSSARERHLPVFPLAADLDSVQLPSLRFNLVSVVRYLNRALYKTIEDSIAPGGILFFKTFNRQHLKRHPGFNPQYVLEDNELIDAFSTLEVVDAGECAGTSFIVARKNQRQ